MVILKDIRDAAEAVRSNLIRTPVTHSRTLSEITGAEVLLKLENLQFTASFKERGALVKLISLSDDERRRGVIAMSAGNHAKAVAYHAQRMDIPATIVMPRFTPSIKVKHTRAFGAEVILHGDTFDKTVEFTLKILAERGLTLIHPYDDPKVIAGQGTVALEILEAHPDVEVLAVPVGGGGLISGVAVAARGISPSIQVVGVQTARFPSMLSALKGVPADYGTSTIAEGIAVKEPGRLTLPIVRELVDEVLIVEEEDIERAVLLLLEVEKTVVEGAGAVGLAALLRHRARFERRKVCLVVSGGNIDLSILSSIIQRGLVRQGQLIRLCVDVRDVPGALADVTRLIGETEANIVQVNHQRTFTHLPLQLAEVEFVLETRGHDHVQEVANALTDAGYRIWLSDKEAASQQGIGKKSQ
jgi:threonine dehydratase